ncbi:MAG TPA: class I SAM-dependent methyltransferase [Candidatus Saccharimonadales bacterium]|nr:class I SAM-dependent methyltransferase [Candidatus Saccharimonadales bacterium]
MKSKSRERLQTEDIKDASAIFYRHIAAYNFVMSYTSDKTILEVGCSDGYGTSLLAKKATKAHGIDIDKEAITSAKRKYANKNLSFETVDVLKINAGKKYDVIISFQVIEHIKEVDAYLLKLRSLLNNRGMIILSTPNRMLRLSKNQKPWNKFHITEYDSSALQKLLTGHFSKVVIYGMHASKPVLAQEIKRLKMRRFIARFDIFDLYNKIPRELTDKAVFLRKKKKNMPVSASDFWVDKKNLNQSLDLIALCKK